MFFFSCVRTFQPIHQKNYTNLSFLNTFYLSKILLDPNHRHTKKYRMRQKLLRDSISFLKLLGSENSHLEQWVFFSKCRYEIKLKLYDFWYINEWVNKCQTTNFCKFHDLSYSKQAETVLQLFFVYLQHILRFYLYRLIKNREIAKRAFFNCFFYIESGWIAKIHRFLMETSISDRNDYPTIFVKSINQKTYDSEKSFSNCFVYICKSLVASINQKSWNFRKWKKDSKIVQAIWFYI